MTGVAVSREVLRELFGTHRSADASRLRWTFTTLAPVVGSWPCARSYQRLHCVTSSKRGGRSTYGTGHRVVTALFLGRSASDLFVVVFPCRSIAEIGFASMPLTLGGPSPSITHSYGVLPLTSKRAAPTFLGEPIGTNAVGEKVWGPVCFYYVCDGSHTAPPR